MARTAGDGITQALIDTQNVSGRKPYIKIYINSTDYTSRLLYLEHHEEAYRERAVIGLSNRDNSLDALDLDGKAFKIGYGYDSSGQGGSSTDKVDTAPLWVKSHQIISVQGERIYQIYAEGAWMRLREQKVIAGVTGPQNQIYSNTFSATKTVYGMIDLIIEGALSWDLVDGPPDDGIMDTFSPVFDINQVPFENAAALLYRLIWMTKSYLRVEPIYTEGVLYPRFRVVYPQIGDGVDETYYSDRAHWFYEYVEKSILLIPNSIVVLCNQDPTSEWDTTAYPLIVGTAQDEDDPGADPPYISSINKYAEIVEVFVAGSITSQSDANNRATAILTKLKSEILGGRLVIPHDSRVELYDKVQVVDKRGT